MGACSMMRYKTSPRKSTLIEIKVVLIVILKD